MFSKWEASQGLRFSRSVHDWELESLALFVEMIYTKSVRGDGCDKVRWKPAVSRDFKVCITLPIESHVIPLENGVTSQGPS